MKTQRTESEILHEYFSRLGKSATNRHRMTSDEARAAARKRWASAREAAAQTAGAATLAALLWANVVLLLSM